MSAIGGPGGIGGPKGPKGPDGPEHTEAASGPQEAQSLPDAGELSGPEASAPGAAIRPMTAAQGPADIDQLAAELRAGRLTPHEAVSRLVAHMADTETLPPSDRAELRELMTDLLANDPHLAALVGRLA